MNRAAKNPEGLEVKAAPVAHPGYPSLRRAWRLLLGAAPLALSPLTARADLTPPPPATATGSEGHAAAALGGKHEEPRLMGKMVAVDPSGPPRAPGPPSPRTGEVAPKPTRPMPHLGGAPMPVRLGGDVAIVAAPRPPIPGGPMMVIPPAPPAPRSPSPPTKIAPAPKPGARLMLLHYHEPWEPCTQLTDEDLKGIA